MLKNFWNYVGQSVWTKAGGKVSTTRIQSYLILSSVLLSTGIYLTIDIINAVIKWKAGNTYSVPVEHITLFGMVLAHHLALLGINKNSENKAMQAYKEATAAVDQTKTDIQVQPEAETPAVKDDGDLQA